METPSNPGLRMVDIEKVAEIVRRRKDVLLAIDNTFLSPYFQVYNTLKSLKDAIIYSFRMQRGHWNSEQIL